jgi:hypothetical protein
VGPDLSVFEENARRTLGWGALVLVLGIGLVGVGYEQLGAVPVLAGLAMTILGIHVYGRLGPEEEAVAATVRGGAADPEAIRATGMAQIGRGLMLLVPGVAVTIGSWFVAKGLGGGFYLIATGAFGAGALLVFRGYTMLGEAKRAQAKVEKRRRLRKSAAP